MLTILALVLFMHKYQMNKVNQQLNKVSQHMNQVS